MEAKKQSRRRDRLILHWNKAIGKTPDKPDDRLESSETSQAGFVQTQKDPTIEQQTVRNAERPATEDSLSRSPAGKDTALEPNRLWDQAYDSVRDEEPKLVDLYEKILLQDNQDGALGGTSPTYKQDWKERQSQMYKVLETGLEKRKRTSKIEERVSFAFNIILSVKSAVDLGVQAAPVASVAWAGVCTALTLAQNPLTQSKVARDSITSIILRMKWYSGLSTILLEADTSEPDGQLDGLRESLTSMVYELYKSLLKYILKCVCFLDRSTTLTLLRNAINLDGWEEGLKDIEIAERRVVMAVTQFGDRESVSYLGLLVNLHRSREQEELMARLWVTNMDAEMKSLQNRKDPLLRNSYKWILENDAYCKFTDWQANQNSLLWVKGDPGKGKTMLLMGIVEDLKEQFNTRLDTPLISYFFCQGTDSRLNTATSVLRGLLWSLLRQDRGLIRHLSGVFRDTGKRGFEDQNAFWSLQKTFEEIASSSSTRALLIIDALDECQLDKPGLLELLDWISSASRSYPNIKWLVSSRNILDIDAGLGASDLEQRLSLELNEESVTNAVNVFIDDKIATLLTAYAKRLGSRQHDPAVKSELQKVEEEIRVQMRQKAAGTFLYVSLAFKEFADCGPDQALERAQQLPSGLNDFYHRLLTRMELAKAASQCKQVLLIMVNAFRPLTLSELATLANLGTLAAREEIVQHCGLLVIKEEDETVYFVHQSALDYLTQNSNEEKVYELQSKIFPQGYRIGHNEILRRSLVGMKSLHKDMYKLRHPWITIKEAQENRPDPDPFRDLRYSCVSWIDHFCKMRDQSPDEIESVESFARERLLFWVESLSLLGELPAGIRSLSGLLRDSETENSSLQHTAPSLLQLLKDTWRLLLKFRVLIEDMPLQLYSTVLAFCPPASSIKSLYWEQRFPFIKSIKGISETWDPCIQTIEFGYTFTKLVFSRDSTMVVSSSGPDLQVWDVITGCLIHWLKPITRIDDIVFSPDNQTIASVSFRYVYLWDVTTGRLIQRVSIIPPYYNEDTTIHEPEDDIWFRNGRAVFSPDSCIIAAFFHDYANNIWLLHARTGVFLRKLESPSRILAVRLSRDGTVVAVSVDCVVRLWDIETGHLRGVLDHSVQSHKAQGYAAFFPLNSSKVLICYKTQQSSNGKTIILDLNDGAFVTYPYPSEYGISADGEMFLSNEHPTYGHSSTQCDLHVPVAVRKVSDGTVIHSVGRGYLPYLPRLACFAPNNALLATTHLGTLLQFWDLSQASREREDGDLGEFYDLVTSPNGKLASSVYRHSSNWQVRLWDISSASLKRQLQCSGLGRDSKLLFSMDSIIIAIYGSHGFSLWSVKTGDLLLSKEFDFENKICQIAIPPGSQNIATAHLCGDLCLWSIVTGKLLQIFPGTVHRSPELSISPDGELLSARSTEKPYWMIVWDVESGTQLAHVKCHPQDEEYIDLLDSQTKFSDYDDYNDGTDDEEKNPERQESSDGEDMAPDTAEFGSNRCVLQVVSTRKATKIAFKIETKIYIFNARTNTWETKLEASDKDERLISFSKDRQYLYTSNGQLDLKPEFERGHKCALRSKRYGEWVTWHGRRIFWIPLDYRERRIAQAGCRVVLPSKSEEIVVLEFDESADI